MIEWGGAPAFITGPAQHIELADEVAEDTDWGNKGYGTLPLTGRWRTICRLSMSLRSINDVFQIATHQ